MCLIGGMVIYQIASGLPRSFGVRLSWMISPMTNRTFVNYDIYRPRFYVTSLFASFSIPNLICLIVIVTGTIFLITKFKESRMLRGSMTGSGKESEKLSDKDIRLVRSVIFICVIFIAGSSPSVLLYIVSTIYPAVHIDNPYLGNLTLLITLLGTTFQAMSCSVNIFVYLWMGDSKKYLPKCFLVGHADQNISCSCFKAYKKL